MKKWMLCLALAVCACGGGDEDENKDMKGTWKADVSGWTVTMVVNQAAESAGTTYLLGTISTNKPACLNNAQLAGTLVNTSVEFIASGGGSATSATVIQFDGEVSGDKADGFLEVISGASECELTRVAATLTRQ